MRPGSGRPSLLRRRGIGRLIRRTGCAARGPAGALTFEATPFQAVQVSAWKMLAGT